MRKRQGQEKRKQQRGHEEPPGRLDENYAETEEVKPSGDQTQPDPAGGGASLTITKAAKRIKTETGRL